MLRCIKVGNKDIIIIILTHIHTREQLLYVDENNSLCLENRVC
jgi:hypothetical protein